MPHSSSRISIYIQFGQPGRKNISEAQEELVTKLDCVKVGELVLIASQSLPRTVWEVGVVNKLKESRDGRIRTVYLTTAKGEIARSVQHLSRLEADTAEDFNQYPCQFYFLLQAVLRISFSSEVRFCFNHQLEESQTCFYFR